MSNWILWTIEDEHGENPLEKPGVFEFNVEFEYDPGEPYAYFAQQPTATITEATCKVFQLDTHLKQQPSNKERKQLDEWFLSLVATNDKLRQQIEQCGLDQMCVEADIW